MRYRLMFSQSRYITSPRYVWCCDQYTVQLTTDRDSATLFDKTNLTEAQINNFVWLLPFLEMENEPPTKLKVFKSVTQKAADAEAKRNAKVAKWLPIIKVGDFVRFSGQRHTDSWRRIIHIRDNKSIIGQKWYSYKPYGEQRAKWTEDTTTVTENPIYKIIEHISENPEQRTISK